LPIKWSRASAGSTGTLQLEQSRTYTGEASGVSLNGQTSLDLGDVGFASADEATFRGTESGGVLTVTDGKHTAHIDLARDYLGATFVASSDGQGGAEVIATSGRAPSAAHFVAAMAGLPGHGATTGLIDARGITDGRRMMLAAPRLALA
jgi:hypothetical protein